MDRSFAVLIIVALALSIEIMAQPVPPYGLTQIQQEHSIVIYWFYPQVNDTVLSAYDGDPQSYLFYSSESVGARLAVGIDLTSGAHAVEAVEIRLWPVDPFPHYAGDRLSPFMLLLHSSLNESTATASLWQGSACSAQVEGTAWQSFPVRRRVETDSVYIEFEWLPETPMAPLPSIAYTGGFVGSYTGHMENGRLLWAPINDAGVLMRLRVSDSDLESELSDRELLPDSFSVLVFDSPDDENYGTPLQLTVRDSMHVEMNRDGCEGRYVSVAAWQNGLLGPKSEMIKLDAVTSVDDERPINPDSSLPQNYPNPFNSETIIELTQAGDVMIFDLLGRHVITIPSEGNSAGGRFTCRWQGHDSFGRPLPSGVYFYRQLGHPGVRKMLLLK